MEKVIPQANSQDHERREDLVLESQIEDVQTEQQSMVVETVDTTVATTIALPPQTERIQLQDTSTTGEPTITMSWNVRTWE